jgi:hypothetical protein
MPIGKKNTARKRLKKSTQTLIDTAERHLAGKEILFPEKVARANGILSKTKFHDPRFHS